MMQEGSKLLGGGRPVTISGRDFVVRPLTIAAAFEFEEWARCQPLNQVLDLLEVRRRNGTPVPDTLAAMSVDAAMREGANMSEKRIAGLYYTTEGTAQLLFMHVRHMSGVTINDARAVVSEENRMEVWQVLSEVSAWTDPFQIKGALADGLTVPRSSGSGDESSETPSL